MFRQLWNVSRLISTFNKSTKFNYSTDVVRPTKPTKKPDPRKNRITLISNDTSVSIVDLAEAEDISKTKRLKLVKIVDYDTQTRRPVYKLMSPGEYLKETLDNKAKKREAKKNSFIKGQKILTLSSKIAINDLKTKINNICKWIEKSYEVKIIITGESENNELAFTKITESLPPNSKIYQKIAKSNDLKFFAAPAQTSNNLNSKNEINNQSEDSKSL